jgi:hypothetical protein
MMPDPMDVMDNKAMAIVPMCNSVRAKRTAVPDIVATASDSRNHDIRKSNVCRSLIALLSVPQKLRKEKDV